MNRQALHGMADITRMILDKELSQLRALSDGASALADRIATLDAEKARLLASAQDGNAAEQIGAWLTWARRERAALSRALADLRSKQERQRKSAQRAFGRADVLEQLGATLKADERQQAQRRANEGR
ncbi:hypothetical protein [Maritimibacter sp. UBA3975]|uniref:hypothetical protein n=1 Tax=Maritimibacter sp. UBA3975 TaxID=1946833 RepID=UPI000C08F3A4|nr:hypothetical protein [Maritimibacter sp. UBA3975]MAM61853.1 hypothetical protein [Maritimibacter sp.]|tara:strand:+ start:6163 stop:6543 length:381 start_codon:yes stop_codon:yes gene_type:complete